MIPMWWQHLAWFLFGWAVGVPVSKWAEHRLRKHTLVAGFGNEQIIEIDEDGKVHGDISAIKQDWKP